MFLYFLHHSFELLFVTHIYIYIYIYMCIYIYSHVFVELRKNSCGSSRKAFVVVVVVVRF